MGYDGWGSSRVPPPAKGSSVERQAAEGAKAQRQDDRAMRWDARRSSSSSGDLQRVDAENLAGGTGLGPVSPIPAGRSGLWQVRSHAYVVAPGGSTATGSLFVGIAHPLDSEGASDQTTDTAAAGAPGCWATAVAVTDIAPSEYQTDCSWTGDAIAEIHLIVRSVRIA